MPGASSYGVFYTFSGKFLMSLVGFAIGILFFIILVYHFFELDITIGAVFSVSFCSFSGSITLRLVLSLSPSELDI